MDCVKADVNAFPPEIQLVRGISDIYIICYIVRRVTYLCAAEMELGQDY